MFFFEVDPEEFRPERFINADGKFENSPALVAFNLGELRDLFLCFFVNVSIARSARLFGKERGAAGDHSRRRPHLQTRPSISRAQL